MNHRPGRLIAGIEAILVLAVMVLALAPGARARPNPGATTGAPRPPVMAAPRAPDAAHQASPVVPYDIVYVRQPRYGDSTNTTWPEVFHPARIDPGADLMLLHPDGSEERLLEGGEGSVTDPFVSFDGQWVYYSYFYAPGKVNTQRDLPFVGADIFRLHLPTRRVEKLTHGHDPARPTGPLPAGEFLPHTGTGKWFQAPDGAYQPNDVPAGYNRLGYGIFNLGPAELAGGRVIFSSNRAGMLPPKGYTNPSLQLYVMDQDGGNVTPIAPLSLSSALHPTPLADGRVMFSSHEAQGLRDQRLWGLWTIYPDGRYWEPLVSAFHDAQAFHFMTQVSNGDVVVVDYYNLNNNGFGALFRLPLAAPGGGPRYYLATLIQAIATYRPRVAKAHTVELGELIERLSRGSLVTESIARLVLADLVRELKLSLKAGQQVNLEGIGIFRPEISLDGSARVVMRMDKGLKQTLRRADELDGTVLRRENIGMDRAAIIARWNAEHPEDPIMTDGAPGGG